MHLAPIAPAHCHDLPAGCDCWEHAARRITANELYFDDALSAIAAAGELADKQTSIAPAWKDVLPLIVHAWRIRNAGTLDHSVRRNVESLIEQLGRAANAAR